VTESETQALDAETAERLARWIGADEEIGHGKADEIVIELLRSLGYVKTVEAYNKIDKWYS